MSATGDATSPLNHASGRDAKGFTLIEALVVVAILTLIGGLAFPRIQQMRDGANFASARAQLLGAAAEARARAVRTDSEIRLGASPDGADLWIDGKVFAELPSGIRVTPQSARVSFFTDGSASGGDILLVGPARRAVLSVIPETGLIRWLP